MWIILLNLLQVIIRIYFWKDKNMRRKQFWFTYQQQFVLVTNSSAKNTDKSNKYSVWFLFYYKSVSFFVRFDTFHLRCKSLKAKSLYKNLFYFNRFISNSNPEFLEQVLFQLFVFELEFTVLNWNMYGIWFEKGLVN